jgi:methionyl-tRNA formyltransferase
VISGTALIIGRQRGGVLLERLLCRGENISGCIIMEDDRHEQPWAERLSELATMHKVPYVVAKSFRNPRAAQALKAWQPSVAIAENWRSMISREVYDEIRSFVVLHESMLPRYRGFAPLSWPIINGETSTGVSLFHISETVDAGDIVDQTPISIGPDETVNDLYEKTIPVVCDLVEHNLEALKAGNGTRIKQDDEHATYACARRAEDGEIDWSAPTQNIYDLVRALAPPLMPGAWTRLDGAKLVIASAELKRQTLVYVGRIPGRVVDITESAVRVLTGDGVLSIRTVLVPGNDKPVPASSVLKTVRCVFGR